MALHSPTASRRGFTLVELMAVIIIISVFATLAAPAVGRRLKERRLSEAAERVASMYVQARARATGRGSAILVRYTGGAFTVREAQLGNAAGTGCAALPSSRCEGTNWNVAVNNQYRELSRLDLRGRGEYGVGEEAVIFEMKTQNGTTVTTLDICFTPTGRAFTRTQTTDPFTVLGATHQVEVKRESATGSRVRNVLLFPNGMARQN